MAPLTALPHPATGRSRPAWRAAVATLFALAVLLPAPAFADGGSGGSGGSGSGGGGNSGGGGSGSGSGGGGGGDGGRHGGRNEVRVAGTCGDGATSRLKLRSDSGAIEVEFEVDADRSGMAWRVVVVREGRVAWRGSTRTHGPSGSFGVSRRLSDWSGADRVTARALGPHGVTCVASAVLPA